MKSTLVHAQLVIANESIHATSPTHKTAKTIFKISRPALTDDGGVGKEINKKAKKTKQNEMK